MPMIEARYNRLKLSLGMARKVCVSSEQALRDAIGILRPDRTKEYGVTVEMDPFGVCLNQPDLKIYVRYHVEWKFKKAERERLVQEMKESLMRRLRENGISGLTIVIRAYPRVGHSSASIP